MKVLVAYASAHGSTAEIAHFMKRILEAYDLEVDVANVEETESVDGYDAYILGSAVHGGMWLPSLSGFIQKFGAAMKSQPVYLFITCVRVMDEGGRDHVLKYYVYDDALNDLGVQKEHIGIFAGLLDYGNIDGNEQWLLASLYDGDTPPGTRQDDYRDWVAISSWTGEVALLMGARPVTS